MLLYMPELLMCNLAWAMCCIGLVLNTEGRGRMLTRAMCVCAVRQVLRFAMAKQLN